MHRGTEFDLRRLEMSQTDTSTQPTPTPDAATEASSESRAGKGKTAAVAAGTGAAVAGIAGGIAVVARDTRPRVLGVPLGRRSRAQQTASSVVDKVQEPVRRVGSRFSRG
jgi:hypothetical protein